MTEQPVANDSEPAAAPPPWGPPPAGPYPPAAPPPAAPQYAPPQYAPPQYAPPQYAAPQYAPPAAVPYPVQSPYPPADPAAVPWSGTTLAPPPAQLGVAPASASDRYDLRAGALLVGVLAALGVLAGLLWVALCQHSLGYVQSPIVANGNNVVIPNETEQFIAADGRFAIITGLLGLAAGLVGWFWRARRGPVIAAALAVGGVVGALLTALIGHLVGGGHADGKVNSTVRLPITVHAHGLIALEAGLALLVYLVGTLVSAPDDLGRGRGSGKDALATRWSEPG